VQLSSSGTHEVILKFQVYCSAFETKDEPIENILNYKWCHVAICLWNDGKEVYWG